MHAILFKEIFMLGKRGVTQVIQNRAFLLPKLLANPEYGL